MQQGPRERLLDAAVTYVAEHGLGDLSLRQLAAALGTSHRMLVYHFGSKEGLLVEVVRAVEERQRTSLAALAEDADQPLREQARRMWQRLADPVLWPHERLFFELYGQALQGRPGTTALLDGIVESWLGPLTALNEARGLPPDTARAGARLGLAVTRGLLLDLLATGDRAGVDAAMDLFLALDALALDGVALDRVALDGAALDGMAEDGMAEDGVGRDTTASEADPPSTVDNAQPSP